MGNQKGHMEKWSCGKNQYGNMRHGKRGVLGREGRLRGVFQRKGAVGKGSRVRSLKRRRKRERLQKSG